MPDVGGDVRTGGGEKNPISLLAPLFRFYVFEAEKGTSSTIEAAREHQTFRSVGVNRVLPSMQTPKTSSTPIGDISGQTVDYRRAGQTYGYCYYYYYYYKYHYYYYYYYD